MSKSDNLFHQAMQDLVTDVEQVDERTFMCSRCAEHRPLDMLRWKSGRGTLVCTICAEASEAAG